MDKRETPAYRIYCVPERLERGLIDSRSAEIQRLIKSPAHLRPNSFGYRGLSNIHLTGEGIRGVGVTAEQELILLENGYIELSCPLRNRLFQWKKEDSEFDKDDWLYPYAIAELPASFLRTASELYTSINVMSKIRIRQEYRNVKGFVLVAGHPGNPMFGIHCKRFEGDDLISKAYVVDPGFDPARIARQLIEEVYHQFGFETEEIPLIEEAWQYDTVETV